MTKYQCQFCNVTDTKLEKIKFHVSRSHSQANFHPYHCHFCSENFVFLEEMLSHQHLKHNFKTELWKCEFCALTFRSQRSFLVHQYSHNIHENNPPLLCAYCDFSTEEKEDLLGSIHKPRGQ